jgi:HSP20 family protein
VQRRRDIERLSDEVEALFHDLWQLPRFSGLRHGFLPDADCYRTNDPPSLTVVVDLAGVDPADVHIDATPNALVVHGHRRRPHHPGRVYQQMQIEYGPFRCHVPLADEVDPERASARYDRGLLTIVLPLAERRPRESPRTIPVATS